MEPASLFIIACIVLVFLVVGFLNVLFFFGYKKSEISKGKLVTFWVVTSSAGFVIGSILIFTI
ncbi:hypothetical protein [Halobacillus sp. B23F22_1]|uniref:hypothetical protein n=1 Tax=Halobacillus sp. B23F22_1 TaxID=3459514 RepID=UPI00373F67A3